MRKFTAIILALFTSVLFWASDLRQVGMVDLPGGREGRSKLLILRQESGGAQPQLVSQPGAKQ